MGGTWQKKRQSKKRKAKVPERVPDTGDAGTFPVAPEGTFREPTSYANAQDSIQSNP